MDESVDAVDTTGTPACFPIVGVGASAGGLAPTIELLHGLGAQPGVAIVVVHHLDPTRESGLVEILSRASAMPVTAALDGARVEPNHVYVVMPNADLEIHAGALKVFPRSPAGGLHLPVDRFFESLARDQGDHAVGVILSGTGSDGTAGAVAIKHEGGVALAQDATAHSGSMPESAIATQCVERVLPPAGLAQELVRLGTRATSLEAALGADDPGSAYEQILGIMQSASGVDFANYKHSTIRRRLSRRLGHHGLSDLNAYLERLRSDPEEVSALCEEVLIHVTGFFRDPPAFEALRAHVFPKLCQDRPRNASIRIWVPGCSTGEEVYSIAIALIEFLGDIHADLPIKIFGTDLSPTVIESARAGRYPASIEHDVSRERLLRFFTKEADGYEIRRDVRELCVFATHDVTRDPPFSSMSLISCRNLMIYLGPELQDRVVALLRYAMSEPGFMLLGASETLRPLTGFTIVDRKNKIYERGAGPSRLPLDFAARAFPGALAPPSGGVERARRGVGARAPGPGDVVREADRLVLAEFAPPGVVVTADLAIVHFRGQTGPFLEPAPGVATLDLMRMVKEELRLPVGRAIERARTTGARAREDGIALAQAEGVTTIAVEVIPFAVPPVEPRFFLILFEADAPAVRATEPKAQQPSAGDAREAVERALRQELVSTRQYLESVIEQAEAANEELKVANEEIVSSNEELRSTNEELQSAKEELMATNEELRTVNDEMTRRNVEATRLSDDLTNVLTSAEIPILILGRDLRLRRFTPAAGRVFGLLPSDVARSLREIQRVIAVVPALVKLVSDVMEHLRPAECTIQDGTARWYSLIVRPYVTLEGKIDGVVVAARDVDAETRAAERLALARKYAEDIVDTVREGLVVLDQDLRVQTANRAFLTAFELSPKEVEGRRLNELDRPALAAPGVRTLLEGLDDRGTPERLRVEHDRGAASLRAYLLGARRIEGGRLVLLSFDDVTELERGAADAQRAELGDILTAAAEGILMIDAARRIVFLNRTASDLFGYQREELAGESIDLVMPDLFRDPPVERRTGHASDGSRRVLGQARDVAGRRKDGSEIPIEVSLSTITRPGGPVTVAFLTDITQRRAAEERIRTFQDRLQRMAFDATVTEDRERRRIAIDLHDRLGQTLALAEIKLASVRGALTGDALAAVDASVALLEQAIADKRSLVFELSPPVLYDLGLNEAIAWLADDLRARNGLTIEVSDDGEAKPLADAAKALVFRAVRELVMNVLKHSKMTTAKVSLRRAADQLVVDVEDHGAGFDPESVSERGSARGFGLLSVREQMRRLGGSLDIVSAPGSGTRATVRVPLSRADSISTEGATP